MSHFGPYGRRSSRPTAPSSICAGRAAGSGLGAWAGGLGWGPGPPSCRPTQDTTQRHSPTFRASDSDSVTCCALPRAQHSPSPLRAGSDPTSSGGLTRQHVAHLTDGDSGIREARLLPLLPSSVTLFTVSTHGLVPYLAFYLHLPFMSTCLHRNLRDMLVPYRTQMAVTLHLSLKLEGFHLSPDVILSISRGDTDLLPKVLRCIIGGAGTPSPATLLWASGLCTAPIPGFPASWACCERKPGSWVKHVKGSCHHPGRKNTASWRDSETQFGSFPPKASLR